MLPYMISAPELIFLSSVLLLPLIPFRAYMHVSIAKIIPIFKNGQKTEITNYRPISILSQFSKTLEKLFNLRLEQFLDANKILSDS